MEEQNRDLDEILRELSRALSAALAERPEVERTLERIRREGYRLQVVLDRSQDQALPVGELVSARVGPATCGTEPVFQINTSDLSFLRSIGIDPTRKLRRRRLP
jgi:hypothetical protein